MSIMAKNLNLSAAEKKLIKRPYQTVIPGKSQTKQQFRDMCDFKKIMENYRQTGVFSHVTRLKGQWGLKPTGVFDFQTTKNLIADVKSNFERLPDKIRLKFDGSAKKALDFMSNPENLKESIKMGLIPDSYLPAEPKPEVIQKVQVVTPEPEKKPDSGQAAV